MMAWYCDAFFLQAEDVCTDTGAGGGTRFRGGKTDAWARSLKCVSRALSV